MDHLELTRKEKTCICLHMCGSYQGTVNPKWIDDINKVQG